MSRACGALSRAPPHAAASGGGARRKDARVAAAVSSSFYSATDVAPAITARVSILPVSLCGSQHNHLARRLNGSSA